jgi:hypothetical protein
VFPLAVAVAEYRKKLLFRSVAERPLAEEASLSERG